MRTTYGERFVNDWESTIPAPEEDPNCGALVFDLRIKEPPPRTSPLNTAVRTEFDEARKEIEQMQSNLEALRATLRRLQHESPVANSMLPEFLHGAVERPAPPVADGVTPLHTVNDDEPVLSTIKCFGNIFAHP
jgi:hypothetical protein